MAKSKERKFIFYKGVDDLIEEVGKKFFKQDLIFWTDLDFYSIDKLIQSLDYKPRVCLYNPRIGRSIKYRSKVEKELYASIFYYGINKMEDFLKFDNKIYPYLYGKDTMLYLIKFYKPLGRFKGKLYKLNKINTLILLEAFQKYDLNSIFTNSEKLSLVLTGKFRYLRHDYRNREFS